MMKKIIIVLLVLLTTFSLAACGNSKKKTTSKNIGTTSYITTSNKQTMTSVSVTTNTKLTHTTSKQTLTTTSKPSTTPIEPTLDDLLSGAAICDNAFINYFKDLGDYTNDQLANNAIYASPNGNGDGKIDNPYSLDDALYYVKPGETLYLRGGEYIPSDNEGFFINKSGTSDKYITIRNYPGEEAVITNSSSKKEVYGIVIEENTSYVVIEGLEIKNIVAYNAFGIAVWGNSQNHLIIRNNRIHDIKTTSTDSSDSNASANGILFNGENVKSVNNIIVANNHIYNNVTGWAESLSVAGNCEYFYILNNLVENNTNIGIDFYGNAGYCSNPSLDQPRYSLAAGNIIKKSICEYADCAGLYVDGARDILLQYNEIYDSLYGIEIGSEEKMDNYPVKNIIVRYNKCVNNDLSIRIGGYEEIKTGVVTSTKIYNNTFVSSVDNYQIIIAKSDGIEMKNNLFYGVSKKILKFDFGEDYIKNIIFEDNKIYSVGNTKENIVFKIESINLSFDDFNKKFGLNTYEEFIVE